MNSFFFFNDTATTEIYTLSLHDALPISINVAGPVGGMEYPMIVFCSSRSGQRGLFGVTTHELGDRKSTRLNSSHSQISYAVFCLKKKKYDCTKIAFTAAFMPAPRSLTVG